MFFKIIVYIDNYFKYTVYCFVDIAKVLSAYGYYQNLYYIIVLKKA